MLKAVLIFNLFLGTAFADSSLPMSYSQEVSIWPEGSKVLTDGIKIIAEGNDVAHDPALVITHPSFLLYSPKSPFNKRPAVIVFPGGGNMALAIGKDSTIGFNGANVCQWLTEAGTTCVLLKYRVPKGDCHWNVKAHKHVTPAVPLALQDAQRTISSLRYNAKKYDIDPNKIGVLGFSAGGYLAVRSSTAFARRAYTPIDEIDQVSARPDFAVSVYPGHLTMEHKNKKPTRLAAQELNTDIRIPKDMPPTLLIHAKDDPVDPFYYSEVYERELRKVGVPVKFLRYGSGGHAFGVKKQNKDTDRWTIDALEWLKEIKML